MSCEPVRDLLTLYAGGECAENERIAVEAHLGVCPECRRELDGYRGTRALLAELREGAAPADTFQAMWRHIHRETSGGRKGDSRDWFLRAAAAVTIGLGAGFLWSASNAGRPAEERPAAVAEHRGSGSRMEAPVFEVGRGVPAAPALRSRRAPVRVHYLPRVEQILETDDVDF